VFWGTTHYLLAVSLYPYDFLDTYTEELRRKFFLLMFIIAVSTDVLEAIARNEVLDPWFYLISMGYLMLLLMIAWTIPLPIVLRITGLVSVPDIGSHFSGVLYVRSAGHSATLLFLLKDSRVLH
jgi:hypothetical protein